MKSTSLYIVRHGETEWNSIGKQQGHLDSPLTKRGVQQAAALSEGLVGKGIKHIYSSDLGRAFETATIINKKLNLIIKTDKRLRERNLGVMQGLSKSEFKEQYYSEWDKFISGDPEYRFPKGESAMQRFERTTECINDIANKHLGEVILIVTHGGVLSGLFYKAVNLTLTIPRQFSLFNAAINKIAIKGNSWQLDTWGDISHLKDIETLDDN